MPSPQKCIEHVVVLMMENRSFDHMLGFLPRKDHLKYLEGLTGEEFNHAPNGDKVLTSPTAEYQLESNVIGVGPPHTFEDVNLQLYGTRKGPTSPTQLATNNGFVRAWIDSLHGYLNDKPKDKKLLGIDVRPKDWRKVMECFEPEKQLPVLSTLAREFVLCDHWFCSVPGPTMPNRLYVHAATSRGYAFNAFGQHFKCRTIYDSLRESGKTWNVYRQNCDMVHNFTRLHFGEANNPNALNLRNFSVFEKNIADGNLAHYSFINPCFIEHWNFLREGFEAVSSQHAPCDVRPGEALIARVYNALRGNRAVWEKTLLVILYDEHGGFYDHVPPPTNVPNPDGLVEPRLDERDTVSKEQLAEMPRFDFTRLGPRTPAILISPWLPRMLDSTVYEHSSLLATVKKLFNLKDFLTERDRHANSFEHLFEGAKLRHDKDTPEKLPLPVMPNFFPNVGDLPLDEVQVQIMESLIPYLPKKEADEVRALLKGTSMTRDYAVKLQDLANKEFEERVVANGGGHPHA